MELLISNIELRNFRGYANYIQEINKPLIILVGPNAIGKTNIIEGLRLLTFGESFKKGKTQDLISFGCNNSTISCDFSQEKRQITHVINLINNKKQYLINKKIKKKKDFQQTCSSVLFTPDDLSMIKAASSYRRDALDNLGVNLSARYSQLKNDFSVCLKQRNKILKLDEIDKNLLELWSESFTINAARLCYNRYKLFKNLKEEMIKIYKTISSHTLDVIYVPSWLRITEKGRTINDFNILEEIEQEEISLKSAQNKISQTFMWAQEFEIIRKTSLIGPQKDDIAFFIDKKNARLFASQGQQRALTLTWKLAETSVISKVKEQHPILFLDDVMSELDEEHRKTLLSYLPKTSQTFITTTDLSNFPSSFIHDAQIIDITKVKNKL